MAAAYSVVLLPRAISAIMSGGRHALRERNKQLSCRKNRDPHGWACLCNGIVVRIAADRAPLIRYASDPDYRASLITKRLWEKNGR
jgi:hypothetical protein